MLVPAFVCSGASRGRQAAMCGCGQCSQAHREAKVYPKKGTILLAKQHDTAEIIYHYGNSKLIKADHGLSVFGDVLLSKARQHKQQFNEKTTPGHLVTPRSLPTPDGHRSLRWSSQCGHRQVKQEGEETLSAGEPGLKTEGKRSYRPSPYKPLLTFGPGVAPQLSSVKEFIIGPSVQQLQPHLPLLEGKLWVRLFALWTNRWCNSRGETPNRFTVILNSHTSNGITFSNGLDANIKWIFNL